MEVCWAGWKEGFNWGWRRLFQRRPTLKLKWYSGDIVQRAMRRNRKSSTCKGPVVEQLGLRGKQGYTDWSI